MSNEITTETSDAIQILRAKINAFNKQWQEYNQNWTNISKISIDKLIKLIFSEKKIEYKEDTSKVTIVERKEDNQLYYYLYNLPNNSGIRIKEENSICYVAEGERQNFLPNKFVYHNSNNFIEAENQDVSNDCLTIDWNETKENWIAIYTYNQYGIILTFEVNDTIKCNNETIVKRENNKLYYYLYNLPNHFGIRINEQDAICYSEKPEQG